MLVLVGVASYTFYPSVTNTVLDVFFCRSFKTVEGRRWLGDLGVVCEASAAPFGYFLVLAVCAMVIVVVGVPLGLLAAMMYLRRQGKLFHGSAVRATPDSWAKICCVRNAMRADVSVGSASASSNPFVCSDWVPPSTEARP